MEKKIILKNISMQKNTAPRISSKKQGRYSYPMLFALLFMGVLFPNLPFVFLSEKILSSNSLFAESPSDNGKTQDKKKTSPYKNPSGIRWETSILEAMEKAKKQNKPLFVELYADWCTTCKTLDAKILPDKDVKKALSPFILVRLNGEEFPNFMERYGARGFPTLLFLDKYSNYISKVQGLPSKDFLIREAGLALANSDTEAKLLSAWKKSPQDLRTNFELGVYYYQSEDYKNSEKYFSFVSQKKGKDEGEMELVRQALYNLALIQMNQDDYKKSIQTWDHYTKKYAKTNLSNAYLHRGIAWRELKNPSRARNDFQKAKKLAEHPEEREMIDMELNLLDSQ